jgi:hypothetical protein
MKNFLLPIILALMLSATACRQALPEQRVVEVLTDMYLYDGDFTFNVLRTDSVSFYRSVFLRHGCSEEDYNQSIAYYAQKPKVMKRIYESVQARLQAIKDEYAPLAELEDSLRNLWTSHYDTLFLSDSASPRTYAFSIDVDTLCTYTLEVSAKYFDDDSTLRPRMKGYVQRKYIDTVKVKKTLLGKKKKKVRHKSDTIVQEREMLFKRGDTQKYTLTFTINDTLMTHIKGNWLFTDDGDTTKNRQHIYLSKIHIYKPRKVQRFVPELIRLP